MPFISKLIASLAYRNRVKNNIMKLKWAWDEIVYKNDFITVELCSELENDFCVINNDCSELNVTDAKKVKRVESIVEFLLSTIEFQLLWNVALMLFLNSYADIYFFSIVLGFGTNCFFSVINHLIRKR